MSDHAHHFTCKTRWTGGARGPTLDYATYSRDLEVEMPGKPTLTMSAAPAFKGDASRHNPEDLLVASLSACHALTYFALCAREKIAVVGYEDDASGVMERVDRKVRFTSVTLRPKVVLRAGTSPEQAARAKELHHRAHDECFIASSVNFSVTNEPEISVST